MTRTLIVAILIALTTTVSAQQATLSDQSKATAIAAGTKDKGKLTGLVLEDSGQKFTNVLAALNHTPIGNAGFSLRVYTPTTWIAQQAADAAKAYRPFTTDDITDEMLAPILRVVVYPDTPTLLTGAGMSAASSVEHVVLRDANKTLVVQPTTEEPFTDTLSSALRDKAYEGVTATFPLDALATLRGAKGDQEFLIVVVGAGTKERVFTVKSKHFERLP